MLLYFIKLWSNVFIFFCCAYVNGLETNFGRTASNGEFPYVVSLQLKDRTPFCDGALLTVQHVLTACHCIGFYLGNTFSLHLPQVILVVAGSVDISPGGNATIRNVYSVRRHLKCEERRYGWAFDYGLLTLDSPFEVTNLVKVLPLYSIHIAVLKKKILHFEEHQICHSISWGYQSNIKNLRFFGHLEFLNVVEVLLLPWNKCQEMLCKPPNKHCVTDLNERSQICAIGTKTEICNGDSGGALVCSGYYYGLASWGPICGEKQYPTVYQAIHDGISWPNEEFMDVRSSFYCQIYHSLRHLLVIAAILHYKLIF